MTDEQRAREITERIDLAVDVADDTLATIEGIVLELIAEVRAEQAERIAALDSALRAEVAHSNMERIEALEAERDKWKNAIIDAAVVEWTYDAQDEVDPRRAVNKLLCSAEQMALDPAVSKPVHDLHQRIERLEQALREIAEVLPVKHRDGFASAFAIEALDVARAALGANADAD